MAESFEILSEILDKLIDTQVQNAQVTADLKNAVEDNNKHLKDVRDALVNINAHFSNGFRQELKNAIADSMTHIESNLDAKSEQGKAEANKILKAVTDFTSALKSPRSWIGAFLLLATIFGTVAGIVAIVSKLMGGP